MPMSSSESQRNNSECDVNEYFRVEEVILKPCHICGRTFNPQSLERHEKVCEKTKKCIRRNVFNSFSQRAKELGAIPVLNESKEEDKKKCKKSKEEHENILRVVKGDKQSGTNVMNNGLSQQKRVPPGYQQCPSCNRCFNPKAADRHIVWCMEQQNRLPKTPPSSEALERLKARIKYRAPLPKRRLNSDPNIRLVKSAESVREQTVLRTHSSPPIPVRDIKLSRQSIDNTPTTGFRSHAQRKIDKNLSASNNSAQEQNSNVGSEMQNKKAVKFKEIFPVYKKERNKNLDMLAALRLRLSELETSDDFLDDCFTKPNENELLGNQSKKCNFPAATQVSTHEIWTSDGEVHCSTSSSSDGSLPSLSRTESSEPRMPRFCYNCGTKYPIVSAKFCCECGARRFVFGTNNNQLYAV